LMSLLYLGGEAAQVALALPSSITGLFQGTLLLFLLAADVLIHYRVRIGARTPLVIAALGELVVERSGVLNLGVEGMMLIGAVAGFIVTVHTHMPWLGVAAAIVAGAAMALVFAIVAVSLQANQVASGLALSLL